MIYAFEGSPDAGFPASSLVEHNGAFFGTTAGGGIYCQASGGCGTVFKLTPLGTGYAEAVVYSFGGSSTDGGGPAARLLTNRRGDLYGTTPGGGTGNCGNFSACGTVFQLKPTGSTYEERIVYNFQGGTTDGGHPYTGLIAGPHDSLFGTTLGAGSAGHGTVYRLTPIRRDPSGEIQYRESVVYNFLGGTDGANPDGDLIIDGAGALYGVTAVGGGSTNCSSGCGTVFKLSPNGSGYSETILYSFRGLPKGDGQYPSAGLLMEADGALYGTTYGGGRKGCRLEGGSCGTVFKLTPTTSGYRETVIYRFAGEASLDGSNPTANLIANSSGVLYGTTKFGGAGKCSYNSSGPLFPCGTVFALTPSASGYVESVLYRFRGVFRHDDGEFPVAGLLQYDGALYGTTLQGGGTLASSCFGTDGGIFGCGTAFKIDP